MKPSTSLTFVGIIILVLGIIPLAAKLPFLAESFKNIPEAGTVIYQSVLILVGIIALLLSGKKKEKMPQIIVQK
jgi:hypothetical protein